MKLQIESNRCYENESEAISNFQILAEWCRMDQSQAATVRRAVILLRCSLGMPIFRWSGEAQTALKGIMLRKEWFRQHKFSTVICCMSLVAKFSSLAYRLTDVNCVHRTIIKSAWNHYSNTRPPWFCLVHGCPWHLMHVVAYWILLYPFFNDSSFAAGAETAAGCSSQWRRGAPCSKCK